MIGLSVSMCVLDLALGKVNLADVVKIIAGTMARTLDDWERVINSYRASTWRGCEETAERIFRQLLAEGKVRQPRMTCGLVPIASHEKHWVKSEEEIEWR